MRHFFRFLFVLLLVIAAPILSQENPNALLTREDAKARSTRIQNIQYDLKFRIGLEETFDGQARIGFDLSDAVQPLRLDFSESTIETFFVNGSVLSLPHNGAFFLIPAASLKKGRNQIDLKYSRKYSTTGDGLYKFKDALDGNTYLYTNFEPYAANQLFPCFDQPDLKSTFRLSVDAPSSWEVISSVRESKIIPGKDRRTWEFPVSPKFSTYLISLHAGPYSKWESAAGKVPLRLFARKSLSRYVDAKEWFHITQQGFTFYQNYFDSPYPFPKYDQILIPDFNWSGMENVGATTIAERFIYKSPPTRFQKLGRADLILHELAHQWFGDLVTMKWWDDLWLNESFASYMAALVMEKNTEFKESWQYFNLRMKRWAYSEDRLQTTHPIQSNVADTASAYATFDGITYGKGASTLKQLAYSVGDTRFRDGIRIYLKKHRYSNASLSDFMAAIQESSKTDLDAWRSDWLSSAGLTGVRTSFKCDKDRLTSITLEHFSVSGNPKSKEHHTLIALFGTGSNGAPKILRTMPAVYRGDRTDIAIRDTACPDFIFPNHDDQDYARVEIEPSSRTRVSKIVSDTSSSGLLRTMLWQLLWEEVRAGKMRSREYGDLAINVLKTESDPVVLNALLETVVGRDFQSTTFLKYMGEKDPDLKSVQVRLEKTLLDRFKGLNGISKTGDSADRWIWFDAYLRAAKTDESKLKIKQMLSGSELDQDRRWFAVLKLNLLSEESALIDSELKRDSSEDGKRMAYACRVAQPTLSRKKEVLDQIKKPGLMPEAYIKHAMPYFLPNSQGDLQIEIAGDLFASLGEISKVRDQNFMKVFTKSVPFSSCTKESISKLDSFLKEHLELPFLVQKNLRATLDEERVCTSVRGE